MIGDQIEIHVAEIDRDLVRIGIRAPRDFPIYRNEIYQQIKESNLGALKAKPLPLPNLHIPSLTK